MSNIKLLSALATVAIAGIAGPAAAQTVPTEITTSVGFTLAETGAVTSLTLSTALSNTNVYSSATSNDGGVFTEAFASSNPNLVLEQTAVPTNIDDGSAINYDGTSGPSTISIVAPGPVRVDVNQGQIIN